MTTPRPVVRFGRADAPLLSQAARLLRERAPRPDVRLIGYFRRLTRGEAEEDGTIRLVTNVDGKGQSVTALLDRQDYEQVVQAHRDRVPVLLTGDLERMGQRWRLLNPHLEEVLRDDEPEF